MDKSIAHTLLGSERDAAEWVGVGPARFSKWPAFLPPAYADRVVAAVLRRDLARVLDITAHEFWMDRVRNQARLVDVLERVSTEAVLLSYMPDVPVQFRRAAPMATTIGV